MNSGAYTGSARSKRKKGVKHNLYRSPPPSHDSKNNNGVALLHLRGCIFTAWVQLPPWKIRVDQKQMKWNEGAKRKRAEVLIRRGVKTGGGRWRSVKNTLLKRRATYGRIAYTICVLDIKWDGKTNTELLISEAWWGTRHIDFEFEVFLVMTSFEPPGGSKHLLGIRILPDDNMIWLPVMDLCSEVCRRNTAAAWCWYTRQESRCKHLSSCTGRRRGVTWWSDGDKMVIAQTNSSPVMQTHTDGGTGFWRCYRSGRSFDWMHFRFTLFGMYS